MQFEMQHQVGTDYSTVKFTAGIYDTIKFRLKVIESFENSFSRLGGEFLPDEGYIWRFPSYITSEVLKEVIRNTCFVCGGLMQDCERILNLTSDKPVQKIKVRKCTACGHSHI